MAYIVGGARRAALAGGAKIAPGAAGGLLVLKATAFLLEGVGVSTFRAWHRAQEERSSPKETTVS